MIRHIVIFSILVLLYSCNSNHNSSTQDFIGIWEHDLLNVKYEIDSTNYIKCYFKQNGTYKKMEVGYRIISKEPEVIASKMTLNGKDYSSTNFEKIDRCKIMFVAYKSRHIYDFNMIDGAYNLNRVDSTCPSDDSFNRRSSKKDSLIIDLGKNSELQDFHILYENDSIYTSFSKNRRIDFEKNSYKERRCILPAHTVYGRRRCFLKQENILQEIPVLLYDSDTVSVNKGFYLLSKGHNIISPSVLKERTGISFSRNVEYFSLRKKS